MNLKNIKIINFNKQAFTNKNGSKKILIIAVNSIRARTTKIMIPKNNIRLKKR